MFDCPYLIEILTSKSSTAAGIADQMKTLLIPRKNHLLVDVELLTGLAANLNEAPKGSKDSVHSFLLGSDLRPLETDPDLQRRIDLGGGADELLQQLRLEGRTTTTTGR